MTEVTKQVFHMLCSVLFSWNHTIFKSRRRYTLTPPENILGFHRFLHLQMLLLILWLQLPLLLSLLDFSSTILSSSTSLNNLSLVFFPFYCHLYQISIPFLWLLPLFFSSSLFSFTPFDIFLASLLFPLTVFQWLQFSYLGITAGFETVKKPTFECNRLLLSSILQHIPHTPDVCLPHLIQYFAQQLHTTDEERAQHSLSSHWCCSWFLECLTSQESKRIGALQCHFVIDNLTLNKPGETDIINR